MNSATDASEQAPPVDSHAVTPLALTQRFCQEGRWQEIQPVRDLMMKECRESGMSKKDAQAWTYAELDRLYPPLDGVSHTEPDEAADQPTNAHARDEGLGRIPDAWLPLPDNAPLPAELSWVQSQRLRIVEERSPGAVTVRLERAGCPAPSWGALGWSRRTARTHGADGTGVA